MMLTWFSDCSPLKTVFTVLVNKVMTEVFIIYNFNNFQAEPKRNFKKSDMIGRFDTWFS